MAVIIKGKIKGCTNGIGRGEVQFRARFVPDEQPEIEWMIPITSGQWHNMKFGPAELIIEIKV